MTDLPLAAIHYESSLEPGEFPAPELSPAEAAIVARFEDGDEPTVDKVARAIWTDGLGPSPYGRTPWEQLGIHTQDAYRDLARAAIGALAGPDTAQQTVQRVLELADELDDYADHNGETAENFRDTSTAAYIRHAALRDAQMDAATRIRRAVQGGQS